MNLVLIACTMNHYSGGTREDLTNIHSIQCLQRSFYLVVHRDLPLSIFFSTHQGISTFRRRRVALNNISALMTLKPWSREDATRDDEIDSEVEESRLVK